MRTCSARSAALVIGLAALLVSAAHAAEPRPPESYLDEKAFFLPELSISSANAPLDDVLPELPNRAAWISMLAARAGAGEGATHGFVDPRSGTTVGLIGAFPLLPGRGVGNQVSVEELSVRLGRGLAKVDESTVAAAVLDFVRRHRQVLAVDADQLGAIRATQVTPDLWQVSIPQVYHGLPVRYGRLAASINHGNLVAIGTETWGNVRGLSPVPRLSGDEALAAGFAYIGGGSAMDEMVRLPTLEVVPVAPPEHESAHGYSGPIGAGYRHRLVWTFAFQRLPDEAVWETMVDAHSGQVIAFEDTNRYTSQSITGGVYPLTNTEICPTPQTCGTMQSSWPMPFADTGLASPNDFTNSAGIFNYTSGTATTTLTGKYAGIVDTCGAIGNSAAGSIPLGGINGQHECTSGGGSSGNTASSRLAFYEVNKLAEQARGWLPTNPWLQTRVPVIVNIDSSYCNAFYNWATGTIKLQRAGNGCRNTGEIAGVIDHEWGHGLDDHDANGFDSDPGEAYGDIAAILRLQTSCVGYGMFWTNDKGCGQTADGTGFNNNLNQVGGFHCHTDCSGVRDADWDKHSDHLPDTPLGFVCSACDPGSGPCAQDEHCATAPAIQAAWDLVARDLRGAPFNYDSQTAFIIGNKLFYQGSGNIGGWYSCECGATSDGCAATNGYMQWLTADDDNGNLNDGTPHMTAIFNAFNRHGIACAAPTPRNAGCGGGPTAAATLTATAGDLKVSLSWTAVAGATRYWVFRSEGHAACNFGKTLIADVPGLSYVDTQVANGPLYSYNVVAAGTSSACYGVASNCTTVSCPVSVLTLANQTINDTQTPTACDTIFAGSNLTIGPAGNATLHAGVRVVLRTGFKVQSGGIFRARVP